MDHPDSLKNTTASPKQTLSYATELEVDESRPQRIFSEEFQSREGRHERVFSSMTQIPPETNSNTLTILPPLNIDSIAPRSRQQVWRTEQGMQAPYNRMLEPPGPHALNRYSPYETKYNSFYSESDSYSNRHSVVTSRHRPSGLYHQSNHHGYSASLPGHFYPPAQNVYSHETPSHSSHSFNSRMSSYNAPQTIFFSTDHLNRNVYQRGHSIQTGNIQYS